MEVTASLASGPTAFTVICAPLAAASVITPIILFPSTVELPFVIYTSASNLFAVLTSLAAGLACSPFTLVIVIFLDTVGVLYLFLFTLSSSNYTHSLCRRYI